MAGPKTAQEALAWIRDAMRAGRYILSLHCRERMEERRIDAVDIHAAVSHVTAAARVYDGEVRHGGTSWRVTGQSADEEIIAVGVEAFLDKKKRRVVVCTVFIDDGEK